jgi:hypothetical protein
MGGVGNKWENSSGLIDCTVPLKELVSTLCAFHFGVSCVFYQIKNVIENIFCCNPFNEERHSHVGKNLRPIQPRMTNLVSTMKQGGKICAQCRLKFYKMRNTCDIYGNPGSDANELEKVQQEEHNSSHEAEDASAANVAIEILNSSLQSIGKS